MTDPAFTDTDRPGVGLSTSDFVVHLWRRKWIIAIVSAIALVFAYLIIRMFVGEVFETRAQVYVRQQPILVIEDERAPGLASPALKRMFTSDHTLDFVRQQYNALYPEEKVSAPLEYFRNRFRTTSPTTVDTTVRTEFSPVIELTVQGESRAQARIMMELWLSRIMNKYGNLLTEEAEFMAESTRLRADELQQKMAGLVAQREAVRNRRLLIQTEINSLLRQLTNAPLPQLEDVLGNDLLSFNMRSGSDQQRVMISPADQGAQEPGLLERRAALDVSPEDAEKLDSAIERVREQIAAKSQEAAEEASQAAALAAEATRLEYAIKLNATVGSQAEAAIRSSQALPSQVAEEVAGYPQGGTLMVLSPPVTPQLRTFPPRTALAGVSAAVVFLLCLVAFSFELYIKAATDERERTTA